MSPAAASSPRISRASSTACSLFLSSGSGSGSGIFGVVMCPLQAQDHKLYIAVGSHLFRQHAEGAHFPPRPMECCCDRHSKIGAAVPAVILTTRSPQTRESSAATTNQTVAKSFERRRARLMVVTCQCVPRGLWPSVASTRQISGWLQPAAASSRIRSKAACSFAHGRRRPASPTANPNGTEPTRSPLPFLTRRAAAVRARINDLSY